MHNKITLLEKYREFLPFDKDTPIVSLQEGFTPLVKAEHLPGFLKRPDLNLYFKLEGLNPTGSFKDRGMTLAVSKARQENAKAVICASTGNTSASAAAYAAKAKLNCHVLLPAGKVALGKLAQAILYGAKIIQINGNFDQALTLVKQLASEFALTVVNSINPYRLEGQKTAAFEVIEELGDAPDCLCIPVGNAGNISAYYRGFKLWYNNKLSSKLPKMCGFQASGAAPMVIGKPVEQPETIATAIRIGNPASWKEASGVIDESKGLIKAVTDDQILSAYQLLARTEGIFCEPSSAASVAGLIKMIEEDNLPEKMSVVCVLTGNGLKDPDSAMQFSQISLSPVDPDLKILKKAMNL